MGKFSTENVNFCSYSNSIKPATNFITKTLKNVDDCDKFQVEEVLKDSNRKIIDYAAKRLQLIHKFGLNEEFYKSRPCAMYSYLLDNIYYNQIRRAKIPYELRSNCNPNLSIITSNGTKDITVLQKFGWYFRVPTDRKSTPVIDRISLNVYPEADLIQKLDKFISKSDGQIEYKVPARMEEWNERHDPITVFFRKPINKSDEKELVEIVTPHVRHTTKEVMLGRKISDGIYKILEPTEKDVVEIIKTAQDLELDPKLIECLKSPDAQLGAQLYTYNNSGKVVVRTSPAIVESVKRLINDIIKLNK